MDTKQIEQALNRLFQEDKERIVFWNDPEREFQNYVPFLDLGGVNVVRLDEASALDVKIRVERTDPQGRYLLYAPFEEPELEKDWLLDIRLYSRPFRADRASVLLEQLGLRQQSLRAHLALRRKFFDSRVRVQQLQAMLQPDDTAELLDLKMIALLVKAEQPEFFTIVRALYDGFGDKGQDVDLDTPPLAWEQLEKLELAPAFWELARQQFCYEDEYPSLKKLMLRLLITDFAHHLRGDLPGALVNFALPPQGHANAVVCLGQWRDSASRGLSYDRISEAAAQLLGMDGYLDAYDMAALTDVMTFLSVEKAVAMRLRDHVMTMENMVQLDLVRETAARRQAGHWAHRRGGGDSDIPRDHYHAVYQALVAAAEFYTLRDAQADRLAQPDAAALYRAYERELWRFDQEYRHFCEAADLAEIQGWNILKPLREKIEAAYTNGFLPALALAWGAFLDNTGPTDLLRTWRLPQVPNQPHFFDHFVQPRLDEFDKRKVFVIISDAFRYEAAQELVQKLNVEYGIEAEMTSQLGVVPSHTALGMASLLPHKTLSYRDNGELLVDGKVTATLEQRGELLDAFDGVACRAADLMAMSREAGRELVKAKRVVYIYHNVVDATGDSAASDSKTFSAVREAIKELVALVRHILVSLNGQFVLVTADHGFLFSETPPGETEKSKLEEKPAGTIRGKKRYLLGRQLPENEAVWHGSTKITAEAGGDMEFWVPRGLNLFHFSGGARFVHGGAMPQEVVVPVISARFNKDREDRTGKKPRPVEVQVLGASHKITTNQHRFELLQTEKVGDRIKPVTLKIAVYEGAQPVTNIETVTFDSASDKMDDRKKSVWLVLQDRDYNKKTPYRLVLRDVDDIERGSLPVVIDRAFSDDF